MTGPDYCKLADVTSRLYAGQGLAPGDPAPTDATRDALLGMLITQRSRDFDHEVGGPRYRGFFVPSYGARTFSGTGEVILEVDPLLAIFQIEINSTPGSTPTWVDYTSELATYKMGLLPAEEIAWPKHSVFRQASFYRDPFPLGNVQILGAWGVCVPDPTLPIPTPTAFAPALTQPQVNALGPPGGGWWATPDDVTMAVAEWVAFSFEQSKAVYAEQPGSSSQPGVQDTLLPSAIPDDVMRVIKRYRGEDAHHPKFALVGLSDDPYPAPYRWAGWQTVNP